MLRRGKVIDFGSHDELLVRCDLYRRIFAHYDVESPESKVRGSDKERVSFASSH